MVDVDDLFGSTAAWVLDDSVAHCNHGSFGGMTLATQRAVVKARATVAANPMKAFARDFDDAHVHAVAAVAGLVGASPESTTLVRNVTSGMDVALRLLPWERGATIVTSDQVYPSVAANLDRRAVASGAHVEVVATDPGATGSIVADFTTAMDRGVDNGPTGVVVDHVASATAATFPVHELVRAARERGLPIVVDGAHMPGQFPVGVADLGADAWTGNLHKWACAPPSLAVLVVHPRHHRAIGSVVASWDDHLSFPANSAWQGTVDPGPLLVAPQVVAQAMAIMARSDELEALAKAGADHVAATVGGQVLGGTGWMRTIDLPPHGPARDVDLADPVVAATAARAIEGPLWRRGIEAKVTPWCARLLLRLSCHAYSTQRDHDRLADALVRVLHP